MMKALFQSIGFVVLVGATALAQAPQPIRRAELPGTPLVAGELRITLKQARNGLFGLGVGFAEVEVKNTGTGAVSFDPQRLSFVRPDDMQIDVLGVLLGADIQSSPRELLIIAGAKSKQTYRLNGTLEFPLKVYYQSRLVGEVVE